MALSHVPWGLQWCVVLGASIVAALTDLHRRRIPNWLTGPVLLAGLIWSGWTAGRWGVADGLLGCIVLSLPYVLLFLIGGGGAGDAKLMGALGIWLGLGYGCVELVSVCVCGALIGICWAAAVGRLGSVAANIVLVSKGVSAVATSRQGVAAAADLVPKPSDMTKMPYGLAI